MNSVGIIGLGRFGKVLASILQKGYQISGYDIEEISPHPGIEFHNLEKVLEEDVIFIAVPIRHFKSLIVDIRDSESFDAGHITSSKNIPFADLSRRSNEINKNDKLIILVCETGSVSANAGEALAKEGFENICILKGGINQWKIDNLPLV